MELVLSINGSPGIPAFFGGKNNCTSCLSEIWGEGNGKSGVEVHRNVPDAVLIV